MPPEPSSHEYRYDGFVLNPKLLKHSSNKNNLLDVKTKSGGGRISGGGIAPGSPMARRTKHEIKLSQRLARQCSASPNLWAKCLVGTCYSIWFIHLPSYVLTSLNPPATLRYAYDLLIRVHKSNIPPTDEVCYRVMMQLCGVYSQPVVAVKLLFHMKRAGLQPNAITYGFYNRAVLEATWPSGMNNSSQLLWNKLRNVILGAALFKKAGKTAGKRRLSTTAEEGSTTLDTSANCGSRTSIDSSESLYQKMNENNVANTEGFAAFDKFRSRLGSIVKPSGLPLITPSSTFKQPPFESSAGLLITGLGGPLKEESLDLDQIDSLTSPTNTVNPVTKRYYRSGSCSEFNHTQLRHTPTSPKPTNNDTSYKMLIRSESFANDAGILAKLNALKVEGPGQNLGGESQKQKSQPGLNKLAQSKMYRRGSLNVRKMKEAPLAISDSCESSSENLGISVGGSIEDMNGIITPKKHKILNPFGSRLQKSSLDNGSLRNGPTSKLGNIPQVKSDSHLNRSPVNSPSRTPVTENDPLGALLVDNEYHEETQKQKEVSRTTSEIELDQSGNPVLFDRRLGDWGSSVVRSATFTNQDESEEELEQRPKSLHRSSTMPTADQSATQSPFTNFKLPFTPSSLTTKKSNELLMGGLSSLKSAATSVAKKFDEIKEAISANSTPVKAGSQRSTLERDACLYEDESEYGDDPSAGRRKISTEFSPLNIGNHADLSWGSNIMDWFGEGSRKGSTTNLGESGPWTSQLCIHLPKQVRDPSVPIALQAVMTTCSKCHNCSSILYDEEIMAGWIPEDSNLNTKCQFCDKATVPLLSIVLIDYRNSPIPSMDHERKISTASSNKNSLLENSQLLGKKEREEPKTCEPITVPYLNPLVLRKEFESILAAEGDSCLTQPKFVDEHPIIYWNMVWMFTRIGVESHLPGLALGSASVLSNPHTSWEQANSSNVLISTMWHNTRLHDEVGQPMYISWNAASEQSSLVSALITDRTSVPHSVMQKVISSLQCSNLVEPLKFLAVERQKQKGRGHSLYREILFLGITALGRENIDQAAFDREYIMAYEKIPEKDPKLYLRCDQPLSPASIYCRQYFRALEL